MAAPTDEYPFPENDGLGRMWSLVLAVLVFALLGALAASQVDQLCFHNVAGVEVASTDSERGPWCDAIAGDASWALFIGLAAGLGVAVTLLSVPRLVRRGLFVLLGLVVIAIPVYMGSLPYTVPI